MVVLSVLGHIAFIVFLFAVAVVFAILVEKPSKAMLDLEKTVMRQKIKDRHSFKPAPKKDKSK